MPFDKSTNGYECYIGSACRTLPKRINDHMRIIRSAELSDEYAKSLHYCFTHNASAKTNFRVLAAFPSRDVPDGYVHLLEAIFMIFFDSCRRSQHRSRFMNDECYEIMRTLRIDTDIPRVHWTSLNAAWPAVQGFRMDRAPCKNKVCLAKVPRGAGFTLCYICTTFKDAKGRLPTSAEVSRLMSEGQKLEAARAKAGPNPPCGDCGRREDFFPVRHLMHHLAPGVLLCGACIMQLKTHGVMHTPEEKAKLVGVSGLISRRRTEAILCDNCAVPESSQLIWQYTYNAEVGQSDFFLTLVAMLPFLGQVMQYYADHQVELEFITKYLGVIVVVFGLAVVGVVGLRATVWVVRIVATVMPP